jgi:hypothetical protein
LITKIIIKEIKNNSDVIIKMLLEKSKYIQKIYNENKFLKNYINFQKLELKFDIFQI